MAYKFTTRFFVHLVFLIALTASAIAQYTQEQMLGLRRFADETSMRWYSQRNEAELRAARFGLPVRVEREDGRVFELQRFIDDMPEYYVTENAVSAQTISSSRVYPGESLGFQLTGNGITVALWDAGRVRNTHQELQGRVTQRDGASALNDHATHVAGTMIASGVRPQARGMAWEAQLYAHDWNNDLSEMTARALEGIQVSNHSYGTAAGWTYNNRGDGRWSWYGNPADNSPEDRNFGRYDSRAREWDELVAYAPYFLPVKSAGNDRGEGPASQPIQHWEFINNSWRLVSTVREKDGGSDGYDCIPTYANAKNILTVGAVNDIPGGYNTPADVRVTSFSSFGPTDDGRIKPDIVANGAGLYSCLRSSNSAYASYSGTSMSAPSISGSIALLLQHQKDLHGTERLLASTIKALLLHTADAAGDAPGPDYRHGWGLMNTATAAKVMSSNEAGNSSTMIRETELLQGNTISLPVYSPGRGPLKVTICWTDPPGPVPPAKVNPPDLTLVNDLDLRVLDPDGNPHFPWVLDPSRPADAATTGDNMRDNVEQVLIQMPDEGVHIVQVTHKGTLLQGRQIVSIITSASNEPLLLSPPNGLTESSITPALQWVAARGALSYELQVAEEATFKNIHIDAKDITATWYDAEGFTKQTRYYWRIRARDAQGFSDWSDVWYFVTGGTPTQAGHALQFDGSDDHLSLSHSSAFEVLEAGNAVTIEAWVNVHDWVNGGFAIVDKHDEATGNGWAFRLLSGGAMEFIPAGAVSCNAGVPRNAWAHVALSWSRASGKARFYLNGLRRCEIEIDEDLPSTSDAPVLIGRALTGANMWAMGVLEAVRIWSVERNEGDINFGMFSVYDSDEPGLVAQFKMDEGRAISTSAAPAPHPAALIQGPAWVVSSVPLTIPPTPVPVYPGNGSSNIPISSELRWLPATSALQYRVQLSRDATFGSLLVDERNITSPKLPITELLPETTYFWRVNANNSIGISDWCSAQRFTTAILPPDAPRLSAPRNEAENQPLDLSLLWEPNPRATHYHAQVSTDSLFEGAILLDRSDIISPTVAVPDLGNNQRCYWRVRGINYGGAGAWSERWTFITSPAEPEAPILISPDEDEHCVSLNPRFSWMTAENTAGYTIQVSTTHDFAYPLIDVSGIPFPSYAASNLEQGVWYYWRVRAVNSAGAGDWSTQRRFKTERPVPETVLLVAPAKGARDVSPLSDFTWQASGSANSYTLQAATTENFSTLLVDTVLISASPYSPTYPLPENIEVFWRARGVNECGDGPWSDIWNFTTGVQPLLAPELRLPPDGSIEPPESVAFLWNTVPGADAYELEIGMDSSSTSIIEVGTNSSVLRLEEEASYMWRARAMRVGDHGPWSDFWTFTTTMRLPDAVSLLEPRDGNTQQSDTVRFSWIASAPNVTRYWFEYAFDPGFFGQSAIDSTLIDTTAYITLSETDRICYWRVRAYNAAGWGPFSTTGSFLTLTVNAEAIASRPAAPVIESLQPNPASQSALVTVYTPSYADIHLEVRDMLGRTVDILHNGYHAGGRHAFHWNTSMLPNGRYLLVLVTASSISVRAATVLHR